MDLSGRRDSREILFACILLKCQSVITRPPSGRRLSLVIVLWAGAGTVRALSFRSVPRSNG
jgi:hypothetical protein